jgi:hypothetical protein
VNLLTHDWRVTASAAPATLLDLANRKVIEIVQVDPEHDVIELRRRAKDIPGLKPYERQVLDHLRRTAVGGVVPATALTTGPATASDAWWARFQRSVVSDARQHGLTRRRFPPAVSVGLGIGLAALVLWLFLAFKASDGAKTDHGPSAWAVFAAVAVVGACVVMITRFDRTRQRDTDAGLEVASRWLGVRRGYADVGRYADLPPAAVVLYGRHLAYATAMDVATRSIARLPLGAEDDRLAWSHEGGRWRQVRVSYPGRRVGWGESPPRALARGLFWTATLLIPLIVLVRVGSQLLSDLQDAARSVGNVKDPSTRVFDGATADRIGLVVTWVIVLALGVIVVHAVVRGVVRLVRGLLDAPADQTITGLVVRRRTWPRRRSGQDVEVHWVAVDNATTDRIRALAMPAALAAGIHQGDRVEVVATPYLGYARSARVVEAAAPLPPPRRVDQLPAPVVLPPVHWTERVGAPGIPSAQSDDPDTPSDVSVLTAALARQIEKLRAALASARARPTPRSGRR